MKRFLPFLLICLAQASYAGGVGYGVLGGLGDALSDMARDQDDLERQKALMRYQYELELDRQKRQLQQQAEQEECLRQQRAQAYQEQQAQEAARQKLADERLALAYSRLSTAHPNWQQIVKSPAFGKWLSAQPKQIQDLQYSMSADDAIAMLDAYKKASIRPKKSK